MQIDTLTLTHFRGFERLALELHPQLTVLAGVNGAGKTSVLEGLAVAAGAWLLGFDGVPSRPIQPDEVHVRLVELGGQPAIEPQFPCVVEAQGRLDAQSALSWKRAKPKAGGRTTYGDALDIKRPAEAAQRAVKAGQPVDLPVIAYYGVGRLWLQKRDSTKKTRQLGSRTQAYQDCLEPASNQKLFLAWMQRLETARIQRIAEHANGGPLPTDVFRPPVLDSVQRAAAQMVEGAERLYFDVAHQQLRLLFEDGRRLPFDLLSDGYRNLVALAADLAWRAAQLNPHHEGKAPTRARGIVLIDEVELHLHPGWQLTVLPRLTAAFPKLQFVVTTHAPLVVASVPAEHIRFLDDHGGVHRVDVANGLSANVVLRELMGVPERDPKTARAMAELGRLLEAGDVAAARMHFDALRSQLGTLDPELQGLEWELRDLEVHGAAN